MANMTDYMENKLTDFIFRAQAFSLPASFYFALFSAAPSDTGGGTELSGNGYARVALTRSLANWSGTQSAGSTTASSGTGGQSSNNVAITFPVATANWAQATHWAIFDAASGGNMLLHGALTTPKTVTTGDRANFSPAQLTTTLA